MTGIKLKITPKITRYNLRVTRTQDGVDRSDTKTIDGAVEHYILEGLQPAQRYVLRITPFMEDKSCKVEPTENRPICSSNELTVHTQISAPENLKIEIITPNYAVLTWTPVEDATRYEVRLGEQGSGQTDLGVISDTSIHANWDSGPNKMCNKYKSEQDDIICFETNQIEPGIQYTFRVQALRQVSKYQQETVL